MRLDVGLMLIGAVVLVIVMKIVLYLGGKRVKKSTRRAPGNPAAPRQPGNAPAAPGGGKGNNADLKRP